MQVPPQAHDFFVVEMEERQTFGPAGEEFAGKLIGARKRLGLSLDDISAGTNIRREFLESIEVGDLSLLPSVYIHVFLKKYAQAVGFSDERLLEACRREIGMPSVASLGRQANGSVRDEELSGKQAVDISSLEGLAEASVAEGGNSGRHLADTFTSIATEGLRIPPAGVLGGGAAILLLLLFLVFRSFSGPREKDAEVGAAGFDSAGRETGTVSEVQERFEKELDELARTIGNGGLTGLPENAPSRRPVEESRDVRKENDVTRRVEKREERERSKHFGAEKNKVPAAVSVPSEGSSQETVQQDRSKEKNGSTLTGGSGGEAIPATGEGLGVVAGVEGGPAGSDTVNGLQAGDSGETVFVQASEPPSLVRQKTPRYPGLARDAGIGGKVFVAVLIGKDGKPQRANVIRRDPAGRTIFDEPAIESVMRSTYSPALQNGSPAEAWLTVPVRFKMH